MGGDCTAQRPDTDRDREGTECILDSVLVYHAAAFYKQQLALLPDMRSEKMTGKSPSHENWDRSVLP